MTPARVSRDQARETAKPPRDANHRWDRSGTPVRTLKAVSHRVVQSISDTSQRPAPGLASRRTRSSRPSPGPIRPLTGVCACATREVFRSPFATLFPWRRRYLRPVEKPASCPTPKPAPLKLSRLTVALGRVEYIPIFGGWEKEFFSGDEITAWDTAVGRCDNPWKAVKQLAEQARPPLSLRDISPTRGEIGWGAASASYRTSGSQPLCVRRPGALG